MLKPRALCVLSKHSTTELYLQLVHQIKIVILSPEVERSLSCRSVLTCLMVSFFTHFVYLLWSSCHKMIRFLNDCYK